MDVRSVRLRKMTAAQYAAATSRREAAGVRELGKYMSEAQAWGRVREGTSQFLPDGLDTAGHHLVVAENEAGEVVGDAWIGPDPRQAVGTADAAWLYDINVYEPFRRRGYGLAILAAAESLVAAVGCRRMALNVNGDNPAAIALYRRSGYDVASMHLSKEICGGEPAGDGRGHI